MEGKMRIHFSPEDLVLQRSFIEGRKEGRRDGRKEGRKTISFERTWKVMIATCSFNTECSPKLKILGFFPFDIVVVQLLRRRAGFKPM